MQAICKNACYYESKKAFKKLQQFKEVNVQGSNWQIACMYTSCKTLKQANTA